MAGLALAPLGRITPADARCDHAAAGPATLDVPTHGWIPTPMVNAALRADPDVTFGGEGAQYPRHVAIDGNEGRFLLVAIDVGGLWRTRDGGDTWEPANVGYTPRGAIHVAIDPRNPCRALAVACNSGAKPWHGLYLTTDQAASWTHVQPARYAGFLDWRDQLVYDRMSYDPGRGYCTDVYWSRVKHDRGAGRGKQAPEDTAIYRSQDGGATWNIVNLDATYGGGAIAVHPARAGRLYVTTVAAGSADGIYASDDGGQTFTRLRSGAHRRTLATSPVRPNALWALTAEDVLIRSDDAGRTWHPIPLTGVDPGARRLVRLAVSPTDDARIAVTATGGRGDYALYVSQDGGQHWVTALFDHDRAFVWPGRRYPTVAWAAEKGPRARAFAQGTNYISRSTDGGASFHWASDGITMIAGMGAFHLGPTDPDHVFVGAKDHNGGVTFDGGRTWQYTNVSGRHWGGHNAGGVVAGARIILAAHRLGRKHGPSELRIFRGGQVGDAGAWTVATMGPRDHRQVRWNHRRQRNDFGLSTCFVDPAAPDVYFAGPYRSEDGGRHWQPMRGCKGVFFALPTPPHTLYGVDYQAQPARARLWRVVKSVDHGRRWEAVVASATEITDVAVEPRTGHVFFATDRANIERHDPATSFTTTLRTPPNQFGKRRYRSVAVDPTTVGRLYACGDADAHINVPSAIMSTDGGTTWRSLTQMTPLADGRRGGGSEAQWVRVHPRTGEAWFTTSCFGIWRYRPSVA